MCFCFGFVEDYVKMMKMLREEDEERDKELSVDGSP